MIRTENLSVTYGKKEVVRDLSLTVTDGELVALIGPNGSGKSSFLKALARILPYEGKIFLDGKDIHAMHRRDYAKRLAMVGQFNDMAFDMTVMDMVLMGRTPYKSLLERDTKEDRAMAMEALASVGMESYAPAPCGNFPAGKSSGRCWPVPWCSRPTICFSTKPPITWTSTTSSSSFPRWKRAPSPWWRPFTT